MRIRSRTARRRGLTGLLTIPALGLAVAQALPGSPNGPEALDGRTPSISADGQRIVYVAPSATRGSDETFPDSVWLLDRSDDSRTELTVLIGGVRPGRSVHPVISGDGCSVVVITEIAYDLFRDDDRNSRWDAYRTILPGCAGAFGPGAWELVSSSGAGEPVADDDVDPTDVPAVDDSGAIVAFTRLDDHGRDRLQVADLTVAQGASGRVVDVPGLPTTEPAGAGAFRGLRGPSISADGRYVAYTTDAIPTPVVAADGSSSIEPAWTDRVVGGIAVAEIWRWDRLPNDDDDALVVRRVSAGPGDVPPDASSGQATISGDGASIAFASVATNLVTLPVEGPAGAVLPEAADPGAPAPAAVSQVYVASIGADVVVRLVSKSNGVAGNDASVAPVIDRAGRFVGFGTRASDLVLPAPIHALAPDGLDLLVADLADGSLRRLTQESDGRPMPYAAGHLALSEGGRVAVYDRTPATVAVAPDGPGPATSVAPPSEGARAGVLTVAVDPPHLSSSDLDLGTTELGGVSPVWFTTIVNGGGGAFVPATISVDDPAFEISGGTCTPAVAIAGGESCTVEVRFRPVVDGPVHATLRLAERGGAGITLDVGLQAVGGVPTLAMDPSSVQFADTVVAVIGDGRMVHVTNTGSMAAVVASVAVGGADPADFQLLDGCTGRTLAPAESCNVDVAFSPIDSGARSATLTATEVGGATAAVVLFGTATYQPLAGVAQHATTSGSWVDVGGVGFPAASDLTIAWDGTDATTPVRTDANGAFAVRVAVPRSFGGGTRSVGVLDPSGRVAAVPAGSVLVTRAVQQTGASAAHRVP